MARPSNAARATVFHAGVFGTIGALIDAGSSRCGALAIVGNLMRRIDNLLIESLKADPPGQAASLASETTQTEYAYRTRKAQPEAYKALCYRCRPARHRCSDRGRRRAATAIVSFLNPQPTLSLVGGNRSSCPHSSHSSRSRLFLSGGLQTFGDAATADGFIFSHYPDPLCRPHAPDGVRILISFFYFFRSPVN
jgi:hypothetical protein